MEVEVHIMEYLKSKWLESVHYMYNCSFSTLKQMAQDKKQHAVCSYDFK